MLKRSHSVQRKEGDRVRLEPDDFWLLILKRYGVNGCLK